MKVLVTGANGFLGREVVAVLVAGGHAVRALVRPATDVTRLQWGSQVEAARADLRGGTELAPLFTDVDAVVHLATQMTGDDFTIFSGTVLGTERFLAAMAASSTKRLVLCSSFSVYDWLRAGSRLDDDGPLLTDVWQGGAYAAAKSWQERMARRMADQHGWKLTVLRPGFVWGRGSDDVACIGQRLGRWQLVFGPLRHPPLTHVRNCADAFRAVLASEDSAGATVNVVDGHGTSAARFARERKLGTGQDGRIVWVPLWIARTFVWLANRCARLAFGERYKLPSMFVPMRFELRYRSVLATSNGMKKIGWRAPKSFGECVRATWGTESGAAAPADGPTTVKLESEERRAA
jgi:nucleoside-diphosphate-sugar epimerase